MNQFFSQVNEHMMNRKFLGCTADGSLVYDRIKSHLNAHPLEQSLLDEAFEMIIPEGEYLAKELEFGRIIGESACVQTDEKDEILFAQRKNRRERSRFVKNRVPEPCSTMVIVLRRISESSLELVTAYIGKKGYGEPWDLGLHAFEEDFYLAQEKSAAFWRTHALIYDPKIIVPGTECTSVWWL
ncbi:hypothetical protein KA405_00695 [Patescibacteria group bacterium]|nr:hypothetical protein [Patescibacteria group bacterium]